MILLIFAALGILIGLLSGGSLRALAHYELRGALLPVAAYLIKGGAALLLTPQVGATIVCLLQYGLLFWFILLNHKRRIWPLAAFAGSFLNFLVILLNGGRMPVSAALLGGAGERLTLLAEERIYAYTLADASTRLAPLGDVLRVGPADMPLGYASAGDIVLCLGVAVLCWQMTRKGQSGAKKSAAGE